MLWRDFAPYVLPSVIGCPIPTLVHHARLTSIDWCRRTACWRVDLDPVQLPGGSHVAYIDPLSIQAAVTKVITVSVGGRERTLVSPRDGQRFVRSQHPGEFCFTTDNRDLQVYPMEPAGTEVIVTATLVPSATAAELDDMVAADWIGDIAIGVTAAIKRIPNQEFSDPVGARDDQARYEDRRTSVAAKFARGLSAAKTRTQRGFL